MEPDVPMSRALGWLFHKQQQGWTSSTPVLTAGSAMSPEGRAGSPSSSLWKFNKKQKGFGFH